MYSSTFSLTLALDGVGGQRHDPAALPPGKSRYPLYRRLGKPQGRSGRVRKISPPPGFDPQTVQPVASNYNDHDIPNSGVLKHPHTSQCRSAGVAGPFIRQRCCGFFRYRFRSYDGRQHTRSLLRDLEVTALVSTGWTQTMALRWTPPPPSPTIVYVTASENNIRKP